MNIYKFSFATDDRDSWAKLSFYAKLDVLSEESIEYVLVGSKQTGPSPYSSLVRNYLKFMNYTNNLVCKIYDSANNVRYVVRGFFKCSDNIIFRVYKKR